MTHPLRFLSILGLVLLGSAWGGEARAWWDDGWSYRKEIGFDLSPKGADIAGAATDVPVLIRLSLGNFQYFNDAKPNGMSNVSVHGGFHAITARSVRPTDACAAWSWSAL